MLSEKTQDKADGKKPSEGMGDLMGMMKDMYQNGDDDMKRMISQSWQKSQEEKAGGKNGGFGGLPGGMPPM